MVPASIRPFLTGGLAFVALLAFYFVLLSFANSREHAWERFLEMWYWILSLAAGFGLQVGLFFYARGQMTRSARTGTTAEVAGAGAVSTGSMVACCAHHLTDFAPLLGVAAAVAFLDQYQTFFMVLGLVSNLVGITIMLSVIQRHHLFTDGGRLAGIMKGDFAKMRKVIIVASLAILATVFFTSCRDQGFSNEDKTGIPAAPSANPTAPAAAIPSAPSPSPSGASDSAAKVPLALPPRTNDENGITITVKPEVVAAGRPATFAVVIDTHSGSLDFDLTRVVALKDGSGNEYGPEAWQGSAPGGHHRSGAIVFPPLKEQPQSLVLVFKDVGGVNERVFTWGSAPRP